jgi:hypothetical protein
LTRATGDFLEPPDERARFAVEPARVPRFFAPPRFMPTRFAAPRRELLFRAAVFFRAAPPPRDEPRFMDRAPFFRDAFFAFLAM